MQKLECYMNALTIVYCLNKCDNKSCKRNKLNIDKYCFTEKQLENIRYSDFEDTEFCPDIT